MSEPGLEPLDFASDGCIIEPVDEHDEPVLPGRPPHRSGDQPIAGSLAVEDAEVNVACIEAVGRDARTGKVARIVPLSFASR